MLHRVAAALLLISPALFSASARASPNDLDLTREGSWGEHSLAVASRELAALMPGDGPRAVETVGPWGVEVTAAVLAAQLRSDGLATLTEGGEGARPRMTLVPSVHLTKGLPLSLELGARAAWLEQSRVFAATGELRWALLEGFSAYPALTLRAAATRWITGSGFDQSALSGQVTVGKQLAIAGSASLGPHAGYERVWVMSRAEVDDVSGRGTYSARTAHHRFLGGVRLRVAAAIVGVEYAYAWLRPQPGLSTFSASVGATL